jgi:hypothetical protein
MGTVAAKFLDRKEKVAEMLQRHRDIGGALPFLAYSTTLSPDDADRDCGCLDSGNYDEVADRVREFVARHAVREKLREIVRKKGDMWVLYAPNPNAKKGKRKKSKPVQEFPTKLAAKRAELARFPPRDPERLEKARKHIDKLTKDPKKAAEKERQARKAAGESVVREGLFREERVGSAWDEQIARIPSQALDSDKKLQRLVKAIEDKAQKALEATFQSLVKSLRRSIKGIKLKSFGVKRSEEKGKTYLAFSAAFSTAAVEPVYVYIENGEPRIELSDQAKAVLTKVDPDEAKLFRAELVTTQEDAADAGDLQAAVQARDEYLSKAEARVDSMVTGLSPLEVVLLKNLLAKKYRKVA